MKRDLPFGVRWSRSLGCGGGVISRECLCNSFRHLQEDEMRGGKSDEEHWFEFGADGEEREEHESVW